MVSLSPMCKLGKELFLELVRVPFQLCAARIRVVVLENELAGNQAQLQRITRRWRGRWRRFAFQPRRAHRRSC